MTFNIPDHVEITDSVLYQKIQDEVVLLNMDNQQYYGLNAVGADMWDNLISLKSITAVTEQICKTYDAERVNVREDLATLVHEMLSAGLLKAA